MRAREEGEVRLVVCRGRMRRGRWDGWCWRRGGAVVAASVRATVVTQSRPPSPKRSERGREAASHALPSAPQRSGRRPRDMTRAAEVGRWVGAGDGRCCLLYPGAMGRCSLVRLQPGALLVGGEVGGSFSHAATQKGVW